MKKLWKVYTAIILFFMYMPIIVLIFFSFNDGKTTVWKGFTLKWYTELFSDRMIINALWNTLLIAVLDLLHRIGDGRREIVGGLLRKDITDIKLDSVSDKFALGTCIGKLHRSGHFLT